MRRTGVISLTCLVLAVFGAACNDDGRTLRPARADQNASISTTSSPTTVAGAVVEDPEATIDGAGGATVIPTSTSVGGPVGAASVVAPWRDGAAIDPRSTCDGADVSPALSWSAAPAGTVEIAITMIDEQAPTFAHWAIAGLDASSTSIAEGAIPVGAVQAVNGNGATGYTGPCPPAGQTHTYVITVHFLDDAIELGDGAAAVDMELAIDAATLSEASVTGTYLRAGG